METEKPSSELDQITLTQQIIASSSGALLTSLIVTPLDVVKIRLQAQSNPFSKGKCFMYCNGLMDHVCVCENGNSKAWYKVSGHFKGTLDAFVHIVRNEGIKSLWSGLPPTLVMAVPATAIYFTSFDQLRDILTHKLGINMGSASLLAGALARLGAVTVISPLELIRTKIQFRPLSYKELRLCISSSVAKDGWLSLWRGWSATVIRDVPFSALYWYNYELGKQWLHQLYGTQEPTFGICFTAGAVSGSISAVVTLPFDVVKTRRQIEIGENEAFNISQKRSSSTWRAINRIILEDGFRGLFAGLIPRLIKVAPACAIMISSYEYGKAFFRKLNKDQQLKSI
uniref:Mitochondrial glutathione transporter SLC25A40 n=1 Tax=Geotrypetes seraphini TaxID=260995 RepID=A0A6P8PXQ4_GEOSA|nr:solute carrier family 25 member 40 isoform X1 [Geotrypetes seraphini]XP_033787123.1 solute carrier family 25 member 40 isoform X1 [Geotrypetes seraphini]XP_033787124.1 solute carrier family 25 member 40 isoform X1 [Geotrypetes seraphini]XP_033787125.1 solute carrier family 25 member 40 isoform X1 [Geotrypetes seraphini]XP_033787126.1 solute carrier family 25 member 40 isoform X1 [Geotrypetes seraphini]XP_033787128.1 solute carrier family 25 member 40 isoform X1 [Geotrypetes seraphini]XP_03